MPNALILSGGSPNMTLMSGALVAFEEEKDLKFDVVSTSGAGALIGLLWAAPRGASRKEALENTVNLGVSDAIYEQFPVNYKAFFKPGVTAEAYRNALSSNPWLRLFADPQEIERWERVWAESIRRLAPWLWSAMSEADWERGQRLVSDLLQLFWATLSPSDLTPKSLGMCANVPFIDKIVDFDKLQEFPGEFYISAYNIYRREMENWGKKEIDKDRFLAAFSFPLIYAPWEVDGEPYYEGASIDCLNFAFLVNDNETEGKPLGRHTEIDTLVVFDMLGHDRLIRKPRDLYDAWVKQIIVPLVEIARDDMKLFDNIYNVKVDQDGRPVFGPDGKPEKKRSLLRVEFDIPDDFWPEILDWSSSNLRRLFRIGKEAGERFLENPDNRKALGI